MLSISVGALVTVTDRGGVFGAVEGVARGCDFELCTDGGDLLGRGGGAQDSGGGCGRHVGGWRLFSSCLLCYKAVRKRDALCRYCRVRVLVLSLA